MIDPVQAILLLVIIVLTVLLVVLGIQVFFILKEFRLTIKKTNKVLDNANSITENIEEPISAIASIVSGFKNGSFFTVAKFVNNFLGKDKDEKEDKE